MEDYSLYIISSRDGIIELNATRKGVTEYIKINTGLNFVTATNAEIRAALKTYFDNRDASVVAEEKAVQAQAISMIGKTITINATNKADKAFAILHPAVVTPE